MNQVATSHSYTTTATRAEEESKVSGWAGWVVFASFMMMMLGMFEAIAGLVGIFKSDFYVATSSNLLVFDVSAWGWTHLIIGSLVVLAGLALLTGAMWARIIAIILAFGSAAAYLVSISLYPVWSVIGIAVSILVVYAVTVHGGELKPSSYEYDE